jgi:hypothetical protein
MLDPNTTVHTPVLQSLEHTLDNVHSGTVKIKTMKLVELCGYYHEVIQDLGRKHEEEKARSSVETSVKANNIRAELKELKDLVLVDVDGFNVKGDKPTGSLEGRKKYFLFRLCQRWLDCKSFLRAEDDFCPWHGQDPGVRPQDGVRHVVRNVSNLFNMSLSAGVFPSAFKTALIHPV